MRAVFDTVILVRGLIGPYSLWGQMVFDFAEAYELVVSPDVVREYLDVVQRPRIARKYRSVSGRNLTTILGIISRATVIRPIHTPAVCRDPADDKFLAAAFAGDAAFIVTEDTDLLVLGSYEGVGICSAQVFLQRLIDEQNATLREPR